jgi:RNA polymerase sigma-70 factor, ECF subfamily
MKPLNFTNIFNQYQHLVYNIALHYVLYTADAEDVAQEVFIKVYKQLHSFNEKEASFKTWIYRIAINASIDFLKKKKAKKRWGIWVSLYDDATSINNKAVNNFHPGVAAEQKEQLTLLLNAIQQLPENQQTAIILTKIEDKPQKEVAEIMNITVKAVEGLLQRAKQNLEKKLIHNI